MYNETKNDEKKAIIEAAKRVVKRAKAPFKNHGWEILGDEMQDALVCRQVVSDLLLAAQLNPDNEQLQTLVAVITRARGEICGMD